jgi:hypothetical protein
MPEDMVAVLQQGHLCLVEGGIPLQPGNPLFYGAAKPGADLKTLAGCTVGHHSWLLGRKLSHPGKLFLKKVKVSSLFADINEEQCAAPDYGGGIRK